MDVSHSEAGADVRPANENIDAHESARLAVVSWLASLKWDGVPRLGFALADMLGGSHYLRIVVANLIMTATLRALRPMEDHRGSPTLALIGPQGVGKSALLRALFGKRVSQHMGTPDVRDLPFAWCHEIPREHSAKLSSALRRACDAECVSVRAPYARASVDAYRWWVVVVTGQDATFALRSSLRFRVVDLSAGPPYARIDTERLAALRDQLFAEAYATVDATLSPTIPATASELTRAQVAVRHVLHKALRDPRGLGRYIGPGDESFQLLALAEADRTGETAETVFERYGSRPEPSSESRVTRVTLRVPLDEDTARDALRAATSIVDARARDDRDADLTTFVRALLDAETEAL